MKVERKGETLDEIDPQLQQIMQEQLESINFAFEGYDNE